MAGCFFGGEIQFRRRTPKHVTDKHAKRALTCIAFSATHHANEQSQSATTHSLNRHLLCATEPTRQLDSTESPELRYCAGLTSRGQLADISLQTTQTDSCFHNNRQDRQNDASRTSGQTMTLMMRGVCPTHVTCLFALTHSGTTGPRPSESGPPPQQGG